MSADGKAQSIEEREYFAIADTVGAADQRLLTIKGWGVTLSLVALGLGFQYRAFGFFIVALVSSISFWILEATVKRHQMRYYPRMREIEVKRHREAVAANAPLSAPRIDWSWATADALLSRGDMPAAEVQPSRKSRAYRMMWLAPHVALPHAVTFLAAVVLLALVLSGQMAGFSPGSVPTK
jgi:hypothetical protein